MRLFDWSENNMRFTEGFNRDCSGLRLHRGHSWFRAEIRPDSVEVLVPTREINSINDTTTGTNLHYVFSSPAENMISVRIYHFDQGEILPKFELNTQHGALRVEQNEKTLTLTSGRLRAVLQKEGLFSYAFFYGDKPLTAGGNKGTAYVTDIDYEADRFSDADGRLPRPYYMTETYIREMLGLDVGEYIYGFGEQFTPFVKNGQSLDIWNRDGNTNCDYSYKSIPLYLSSKGYCVLVNSPDQVEFEVGSIDVRNVEFSVPGEELEYIVIGGADNREVLSRYTGLTGRSALPPAWSFGLWLSSSFALRADAETALEFVKEMKQRDIPLSVFHFDCRWMDDFNSCDFVWSDRFGDAKKLLQTLHDQGVRICVWINPYISQESILFKEGRDKDYFIKHPDGRVWQTDAWMSAMAIVDFTNPKATSWYLEQLEALIDMGVDCFKTDFAERLPTKVVYHDGSDPHRMHNYYSILYHQAVFGLLQRKKGEQEACLFARSATVGTQQFPVHWGGDNAASYVSMAETLRGGLSFCQSGFGFWAHDIGGFNYTPTPDLYKRWVAFGLLSTHSRLHGFQSYRVPWCFDEESSDVLRHFSKLKNTLMPYLYAGAVRVHQEGIPLMQPMMLTFPDDISCLTLDRQYMLGDSLLVAPVFREDGTAEFYVPAGSWTDYQSGQVYEGGRWYRRQYDYFSLPLLVRPASILPVGSYDHTVEYDYAHGIRFKLYAFDEGDKSEFKLYDMTGRLTHAVTTVRQDDQISFVLHGPATEYSVQLIGVQKASHILGATGELHADGLLLRPDAGIERIVVQL